MAWTNSAAHRRAALEVIQRVLDGELTLDDIRQLHSAADRAYAAVGWMLRNPDNYLDEDRFVLSKYEDTLVKIAGRSSGGSPYGYYTQKAGLHVGHSSKEPGVPKVMVKVGGGPYGKVREHEARLPRVIRLLPLEREADRAVIEPGEELLAAALAHQVLEHGDPIAREVLRLLREKLSL